MAHNIMVVHSKRFASNPQQFPRGNNLLFQFENALPYASFLSKNSSSVNLRDALNTAGAIKGSSLP